MQKSSLFCVSQDLRPSPQCSPFGFDYVPREGHVLEEAELVRKA